MYVYTYTHMHNLYMNIYMYMYIYTYTLSIVRVMCCKKTEDLSFENFHHITTSHLVIIR